MGLLSVQPDSRSSSVLVATQKWLQLSGSQGVVDLYPPTGQPLKPQPPPQPLSSQTETQVLLCLLYRITGSPTVLLNGPWPLAFVSRVKVAPPSVETDAPEMLMGLKFRPRESL